MMCGHNKYHIVFDFCGMLSVETITHNLLVKEIRDAEIIPRKSFVYIA